MKLLTYLLILVSLNACQNEGSAGQSDLLSGMNKKIEALTEQLTNSQLDTVAQEELEKLFVFEYKVHEFTSKPTSADLEQELNKLGKERWECFHLEIGSPVPRAFCKRRPKTYLRYIPRVF